MTKHGRFPWHDAITLETSRNVIGGDVQVLRQAVARGADLRIYSDIRPAIPLRYESGGWDYSWLVARSDGRVFRMVYNPYSLQPEELSGQYEIKWFYR